MRSAAQSRLTLVLGHGAGGGIDAADLALLADALPARGVDVVRVEQPWRMAGRRVAAPPATLDRAWISVLRQLMPGNPVAVGGRSAGARVACRTARATGAIACVALAFPLHPPGRPETSRRGELTGCGVPTLVVQGDRDPFGGAGDFSPDQGYAVHRVPFADHSFRVARSAPLTQREALGIVIDAVDRFLRQFMGMTAPAVDERVAGR